MALLRAVGIPCSIHGFTIDKKLQKGAMTGLVYILAPKNVFHSWVELEGIILDIQYLNQLQKIYSACTNIF